LEVIIRFTPQRSDLPLVIDKVENGFVVNGTFYDFSQVTTDIVPIGPIISGSQNEVTFLLPVGANPLSSAAFPDDINITVGVVVVPGQNRSVNEGGTPTPQVIENVVIVQNQPTPEPVVPQIVTMRQARLALLGAGKLALVEAAIEALPEPPKTAAKIEWEYSQEVHRNKPFVQMLAQGLGLTEAEIDQLFILASTL
jgi:hypothetical protein